MKKKAVIMGGGNGTAITTQALKENLDCVDISSVVSMSDSGGSSGRLRAEFDTLPPGDILRAVLAMSVYDYKILKVMFNRIRFKDVGKLDDHNLGNLFLVLAEKYSGDYVQAVRALEQAVQAVGKVYPVTLDRTDLIAGLEDGQTIKTEAAIDRPSKNQSSKIKKAWLDPVGQIYPNAAKALEQADYIFLGPGSLYCSVVATLLPKGTKEAINNSKAKLVYIVGNAYEKKGENGPGKLSDFIKQLESYLPRKLDMIVYNNAELTQEQKEKYSKKGWELIEFDKENLDNDNIVCGDYEKESGGLSKTKLGKLLKDTLCNK